MVDRLKAKIAIVTGAGRGIGASIASVFAREGTAIVIAERNSVTGSAIAQDIADGGARSLFVETDVSNRISVESMVARSIATFGGIDILINNAGVNVFHEPLETTDEEWRRCLAVDLEGAWLVSREVPPSMRAKACGANVNIASSHSFSIIPNAFPYPVAKHGLLGLTRALGIQYAAEGIRVSAIAPGYIETPIAQAYWDTFPDPEEERRRTYDLHPPKRIGKPEEIAMTALFLASDEAPFINAACIVIDGGQSVLYHA
jgi:NAD(P)-dependent dehydrogenase (short-subunit alcohol dehydrogenase family)